jgi:hypothetical protein
LVPYCAVVERTAITRNPEVLIVLDRSDSMKADPGGAACSVFGCSKWEQTIAAVGDIVLRTDTKVDWGLKLSGTSSAGCGVDDGVEVPPAPTNAAAVVNAMAAVEPGGGAPTRLAANAAFAYLSGLANQQPKYLLLATDGLPSCAPGASDPAAGDTTAAVQAVAAAADAGVPTLVLGVPTTTEPTSDATLTMMATAGLLSRSGAPPAYYPVSASAELVAFFTTFFGLGSCNFSLSEPTANTSPEAIDIFANGKPLPRDTAHRDGWDYTDSTETFIEVYGPTCEDLLNPDLKARALIIAFRCLGG